MTVALDDDDPRASRPGGGGGWRSAGVRQPGCDRRHEPGRGRLDERARRLSHEELAVATHLVAEGHEVVSVPARPGRGPTPDLLVCGTPVEVKSWRSLAERDGRPPGPKSVVNKLLQARAQASVAILDGRGSGLTPVAARAGLAELGRRRDLEAVRTVRILGDGFDLSWSRERVAARLPERATMPRRRSGGTPGPELGRGSPG